MEVEKTLPPETPAPATDSAPGAVTDGLAARIAAGETNVPPVAAPARKNKGGRPPTHGLYSKAAGSDGKKAVKVRPPPPAAESAAPVAGGNALPTMEAATPTAPRVVVPDALLSRVVRRAIETAERVATTKLAQKASAAGLTRGEIEPQLEDVRFTDNEKDSLEELTPLILEEWGIDPQVSPSAVAAAILIPRGHAYFSALNTLTELAKERNRKPYKSDVESQKIDVAFP